MALFCQFGRHTYQRIPFGGAPVGDTFQREMDKIFRELLNTFGITDDIPIVGYANKSVDHDRILCRVLQICRKELKA